MYSKFLENYHNQDLVNKYKSFLYNGKEKVNENKIQELSNKWINYKKDYRKYLNNVEDILDSAVYHQFEAQETN